MPVITFFQTKGGTGKTTSAFALAEILGNGKPTTVIDADRRQPFSKWQKRGGEGHRFEIVSCIDEDQIAKTIHDELDRSTFVIVDTEGSGNVTSAKAVALSDLVIVTTTGSALDQDGVGEAVAFVKKLEKQTGRPIAVYILMARQPAAIVTKAKKIAHQQMIDAGLNVFESKIIERAAFEAIFGYSMTLFNLDPKKVRNPHHGYYNARVFANEVLKTLVKLRDGQAAEAASEGTTDKEAA